MFIPKSTCSVGVRSGFDGFGKEQFASLITELCTIIMLQQGVAETQMRQDRSASGAHAREFHVAVALQLSPLTRARLNDKIVLNGSIYRVKSRESVYTPFGVLDHMHVECEAWV